MTNSADKKVDNSADKKVDSSVPDKNLQAQMLEKSIQERLQKLNSEKASSGDNGFSTTSQTLNNLHARDEWWSVADAMTISSSVLIFGCIIMVLATFLIHKGKNADEILKLFGTIIIIISAVFLVVAGYTDTQIAPVIGLLGTIAGYLLGRRSTETPPNNPPVETKTSPTK